MKYRLTWLVHNEAGRTVHQYEYNGNFATATYDYLSTSKDVYF